MFWEENIACRPMLDSQGIKYRAKKNDHIQGSGTDLAGAHYWQEQI